MKNINIDKLDIFQLQALKDIVDSRAEFYSKNIPDYAILLGDETSMRPAQRDMLDKYNNLKMKSSRLASMMEDYLLNTLLNVQEDKKDTV